MNQPAIAKQSFTVTTPLYYVNDIPHIGHAYTTMAADAIARWQRLNGSDVLLITGTDEHGQKIERTAIAAGVDPQVHCDRIVERFDSLWSKLNIQYDRFSRTTAPNHQIIVKEFFQRVWESGDIYKGTQQGWYCVSCEEFKEERDLLADKHCPLHPSKQVEWRDESNYFFRLSKYQQQLEALYAERPDFILPNSRRNEVLKFVAQGLQDFSISRVNVDWGIPLPADPQQTIYVWFDALLGYMTALLDPDVKPSLDNALQQRWPINLHLIGKDILRFHAVYWPAMLMSAGLPIPARVFAHGYFTKDGKKISKSEGNAIDPIDLVDRYGAESLRYYFLKEIEFGQDGDFNETRFVEIVNADLANSLGNLVNRTLGMAKKYCQGQVPNCNAEDISPENPLKILGQELGCKVNLAYNNLAFRDACETILTLVRSSNKYIDDLAPWALFKQDKHAELAQVLYSVLESARLSAYLLSPIIPKISTDIYRQLGLEIDFDLICGNNISTLNADALELPVDWEHHQKWGILTADSLLGEPHPIFAKLETPSDLSS
ncbi:methionine--tRNA ligase [Chamaesiphon sp. VAR_48_metabat_135_sub]|uniref:methionine--tRNA ligase n=1 Tax=Chamaesiphon sp. VAR_48_metabat_135_sub TaxID=2964699 RepID=UPI00286B6069|nr:methionine--tRNA ligase [Chamaesiphon sp. VAR_48_metabat_135_sub]